jgi:hypothetical protein
MHVLERGKIGVRQNDQSVANGMIFKGVGEEVGQHIRKNLIYSGGIYQTKSLCLTLHLNRNSCNVVSREAQRGSSSLEKVPENPVDLLEHDS